MNTTGTTSRGRVCLAAVLAAVALSIGASAYAQSPPIVAGVSPQSGPTTGQITLTISGIQFGTTGATATIGGALCPLVTQTNAQVTCTLPEGQGRDLLVQVTTSFGSSSQQVVFSYTPPEVTDVTPEAGPSAGSQVLTLTGSNFGVSGATVVVAGAVCPLTEPQTHSELRCASPPGSDGPTSVRVFVGGQASNSAPYEYVDPPSITTVSPSTGPTTGAIPLTIEGSNFRTYGATVQLGASSCTVTDQLDVQIHCTLPPGVGPDLLVRVTTEFGVSTEPVFFSYLPPAITGVAPSSGPTAGGTPLTIDGLNFGAQGAAITVGGNACPATAQTHTQLRCTTPPGVGGTADVRVMVAGQLSNVATYEYVAAPPSVVSVEPTTGQTAGGFRITISGQDFGVAGATASVGGADCPVLQQTDIRIVCTTPEGQGADQPVEVSTASGSSSEPVFFSYLPPAITGLAPSSGPTAGGTVLTLQGSNFGAQGASITVGGNTCPATEQSHTELRCTAPPSVGGPAEVRVTVADQVSNVAIYEYVAGAPVVTSVEPTTGQTVGGFRITISGTDFGVSGAAASVGGVNCPVLQQNDIRIVCTTPEGQGVDQPVEVSTAAGSSSATVVFSYLPPLITGVEPSSGLASGGTVLTIQGSNFGAYGASVSVGGATCPTDPSQSHTELRCTTPPGSGHDVPVQVSVAGQSSNLGSFSYSQLCSPGFASPNGTTLPDACTPCSPGSYSETTGAVVCKPCTAGTSQPLSGAIACSPCTAGTFQPLSGAIACTSCTEGTFQPLFGAVACMPCAPCADGDACTLDSCDAVDGSCAFPTPDDDADAVSDLCDNCAGVYNPTQLDGDVDTHGDLCDNCPAASNAPQSDLDADSEGDVCDTNDGMIYQLYQASSLSPDDRLVLWQAESGYDTWNLYFGALDDLLALGLYTQAPGSNALAEQQCALPQPVTTFDAGVDPAPGHVRFSLVTGTSGGVEGSLGEDSQGLVRPNANPCSPP